MYNELPHTGFGALVLTAAALIMGAGGWVMQRLSRRRAQASES